MAKEIRLSRGQIALVDDEDYELVSQFKWYKNDNGYAVTSKGGKKLRMHRLITNAPKGLDVDHKNGARLDNRKDNLRIATRSENSYNKGIPSNNTSGFMGVYWSKQKNKWHSRIRVNGKDIHLGFFENKVDAAFSYNEAALKYHGEFAQINLFDEVVCE